MEGIQGVYRDEGGVRGERDERSGERWRRMKDSRGG
jgi:hypothetical protein